MSRLYAIPDTTSSNGAERRRIQKVRRHFTFSGATDGYRIPVMRNRSEAVLILDPHRFPTTAVLDVLYEINRLKQSPPEPIEISIIQTIRLMKNHKAIVLPNVNDSGIEVWLADGPRVRFEDSDEFRDGEKITKAFGADGRAWSV